MSAYTYHQKLMVGTNAQDLMAMGTIRQILMSGLAEIILN